MVYNVDMNGDGEVGYMQNTRRMPIISLLNPYSRPHPGVQRDVPRLTTCAISDAFRGGDAGGAAGARRTSPGAIGGASALGRLRRRALGGLCSETRGGLEPLELKGLQERRPIDRLVVEYHQGVDGYST